MLLCEIETRHTGPQKAEFDIGQATDILITACQCRNEVCVEDLALRRFKCLAKWLDGAKVNGYERT